MPGTYNSFIALVLTVSKQYIVKNSSIERAIAPKFIEKLATMTLNIEYDIKELFDKLESKLETKFDKLDAKIDRLETKFDKLEDKVDKLEDKVDKIGEDVAQLKTDVKVLDQKVVGIDKRLDAQEFINRGVAIGLLVALLGGLAKIFGFDGIR